MTLLLGSSAVLAHRTPQVDRPNHTLESTEPAGTEPTHAQNRTPDLGLNCTIGGTERQLRQKHTI